MESMIVLLSSLRWNEQMDDKNCSVMTASFFEIYKFKVSKDPQHQQQQ